LSTGRAATAYALTAAHLARSGLDQFSSVQFTRQRNCFKTAVALLSPFSLQPSTCAIENWTESSLNIRSSPDVLYSLLVRSSLTCQVTDYTSPQGKSLSQSLGVTRHAWLTRGSWLGRPPSDMNQLTSACLVTGRHMP
jgi:hypothetical protein